MEHKQIQIDFMKNSDFVDNKFIRYNKEKLQLLENSIKNLAQTHDYKINSIDIEKWVATTNPNNDYKEGFQDDNSNDKKIQKSSKKHTRAEIIDELLIEESKIRGCYKGPRTTKSLMYSRWEDREILKYILLNKLEKHVGGKLIWQAMENDGILERSWESLRNRYHKHILKEPLLTQLTKPKGKQILLRK